MARINVFELLYYCANNQASIFSLSKIGGGL